MFKFRYLITFSALALAGTAAYFSVMGLGQLFAGAGVAIIIMASILEASKLVAASLLERYWGVLSWGSRIFFTIAVGVLMCITSAGIYGLLSSGYEKTASQLGIHDTEVKLIEAKIGNYEKSIESNTEIITTKSDRVKSLTGLRDRQESRLDSLDVRSDWKSRSTANKIRKDIKGANEEIGKLNSEIDGLVITNSALMDSVGAKKIVILEMEANNEAGAELGPLKYLAELTGKSMDVIISYFILAIIIVFDPLAIALVVVANKLALKDKKPKKEEETNEPDEEEPKKGEVNSEAVKEYVEDVKKRFNGPVKFRPEDWQIKDFAVESKKEEEVKQSEEEILEIVKDKLEEKESNTVVVTEEELKDVPVVEMPTIGESSDKVVDNVSAIQEVLDKYSKDEKDIYDEPKVIEPKPVANKPEPKKAIARTNTMRGPKPAGRNFTVNIPKNENKPK